MFEDAVQLTFPKNPPPVEDTSYMQVCPAPEYDQLENQYPMLNNLYELFLAVSGQIFRPCLSMSRFLTIRDITTLQIQRVDLEIIYRKAVNSGSAMDFYRFVTAIEHLVERIFGNLSMADGCRRFLAGVKPQYSANIRI